MARATQAERRATTRRALLDATVASLVEHGYAATTTTMIVRRAGVSQGALFAHFPTKQALLAAAVEDLYPRLVAEYAGRIASAPNGGVLAPLLEAMERPETRAAIELLVAARTDAELREILAPVEAAHRQAIREAASELLGPGVDACVDLAIDLALGMSVSSTIADRQRVTGELGLAESLLQPLLPKGH